MQYKIQLWIGLCLALLIVSCDKEVETSNPKHSQTPYDFDIPGFVQSAIGIPSSIDSVTKEKVVLGKRLFFDSNLSKNGNISCASCHLPSNAFSDPNPNSLGTDGLVGNRNAMAVINLAWDQNFFWDGRSNSMEDQAHGPVVNPIEMNHSWKQIESDLKNQSLYRLLFYSAYGDYNIDSTRLIEAITSYEKTLMSFESKFDSFFYLNDPTALNTSEQRGYDIFFGKAECVHCHGGPLLTDQTFKNNGLDEIITDVGRFQVTGNILDMGKMKVPTLRNIALTAPYMHDGRFLSLIEVIDHYDHGVKANSPNLDPDMSTYTTGLQLTSTEKADLLHFLETFTDQNFINKHQ